jgi:hypothetical protein
MVKECFGHGRAGVVRVGNLDDVVRNFSHSSSPDDVPSLPIPQLLAVLKQIRSVRQNLIIHHQHQHRDDVYDALSLFKNKNIVRSFWYEVPSNASLTPCSFSTH